MGTKVAKKKKKKKERRVSFASKLWSLVMKKSSQEEYIYRKCIRNYGVKKENKKV
jgi:hypothetical protein